MLILGVFGGMVLCGSIGIGMHPLALAMLALTAIHSILGLTDRRGIGGGRLVLYILEILVFYKFPKREKRP